MIATIVSQPTNALRHQPYRLFFPLGAVLGAVGVGYWLLHVTGALPVYQGLGHALAQVEGFLLAFAIGFLTTMIPRRLQAEPPGAFGLVVVAALLVVTTFAAMAGRYVLSQAATLVVLLWLAAFALRRLARRGGRRPPDAFVLIPIAFGMALVAVTLLLLRFAGALGDAADSATSVARGMLFEGVFLCLVLGIGRFLLPVLFGHAVPGDMEPTAASRRARALFATAGLVLVASYALQPLLAGLVGAIPATSASPSSSPRCSPRARGACPSRSGRSAASSGSPPGSSRPGSCSPASSPPGASPCST